MRENFEAERNLLAHLGIALIYVQLAERLIKQTLLFVIQEGVELDYDTMQKQSAFLDRKTLGRLVGILKERADLEENFEALLTRFLDARNILAHDLDRIEGFDHSSPDGISVGHAFLSRLVDDTLRVIKIFSSLNIDWSEETGIAIEHNEKMKQFVGEDYEGIAEYLFFAKPKK